MRLFYHLVAAAMVCLLPSAAAAQQLSNPSMTVYSGIQQPEGLHLNENGQATGYHYYFFVLYGDEVVGFVWQKQKWLDQGGNHRRENIGLSRGFLDEQPGHKWYVSDIVGIADDGSVVGAVRDTLNNINTVQYFVYNANDESFLLIDDESTNCDIQSLKLTAVSPNGIILGFCRIGNTFPGVEVTVNGAISVSAQEYGNSYGLNSFNESIEDDGICIEGVCEGYPGGFAPGVVEYNRGTTPRKNGGININSVVAGAAGTRAALADNGTAILLELPAGYVRSVAFDVNDNGEAVGYAETALGQRVAAYWPDETTMIDLNAVLYPDRPDPVLIRAEEINNAGDILATYTDGGTWHAQFVTGSIPPTPPPPPPYLLAAISAQNLGGSQSVGDPVNLFTGEFYATPRPDLFLDGPVPLSFERYYSSALGTVGGLGANWRHTYEWRTTPTFRTDRSVIDHRGRVHTFVEVEPGQWINRSVPWLVQEFQVTAHVDRPYTLLETNEGFEFVDSRSGLRRLFDYGSGRLLEVVDRNGNRIHLIYSDSLLTRVTDNNGRELQFSYTGRFLQSISDGPRTVLFEQTGCRLTGVTSPEGRKTTYRYDSRPEDCDALLTAAVSPTGGIATQQIYDATGAVASQTTEAGTVTFEYCHKDDVYCFDEFPFKRQADRYNLFQEARVTDARGNLWSYVHDPEGRLIEASGPSSYSSFEYSYDNAENRVDRSLINHGSTSTSIDRDSTSGAVRQITFADNSVLQPDLRSMESDGAPVVDLFGVRLPNGASESFERDASGNITRIVDASGEVASYAYDARGRLTSSTDPEGNTTSYTYNAPACGPP